MNTVPAYRITANDQDITDKIRQRFKAIRITDETGAVADTVEIDLADHDQGDPIKLPPVGAELTVAIGYGDTVRDMGLYVVDEIELAGWPCSMAIRARAAPFEASKAGKSDLHTQKTRTWRKGTTIGDLVTRIAAEHGMEPAVSGRLSGIALPSTPQAQESDINLLMRLAARYDAVAKPAGGRLVFVPRGEARSASGQGMESVTLTPEDGGDFRVTLSARNDAGTTVAYYRDMAAARRQEVTIGDGDPVVRIRMAYPDRVSAEAAARARHRQRARGTRTLSYTVPGRPALGAETIVTMQGFREGVDGDWLVKRAEHYIGPGGYRTTIECEQPNSADEVREADGAGVDEAEQVGEEV